MIHRLVSFKKKTKYVRDFFYNVKGLIIGMLKAEIGNRTVGKADNYRTVIYEEIRLLASTLVNFFLLFFFFVWHLRYNPLDDVRGTQTKCEFSF